jgi:hypothetical protein
MIAPSCSSSCTGRYRPVASTPNSLAISRTVMPGRCLTGRRTSCCRREVRLEPARLLAADPRGGRAPRTRRRPGRRLGGTTIVIAVTLGRRWRLGRRGAPATPRRLGRCGPPRAQAAAVVLLMSAAPQRPQRRNGPRGLRGTVVASDVLRIRRVVLNTSSQARRRRPIRSAMGLALVGACSAHCAGEARSQGRDALTLAPPRVAAAPQPGDNGHLVLEGRNALRVVVKHPGRQPLGEALP